MTAFLDDACLALRQHVRQPGYALIVVSTLGLSMGATIAVFSVVNTVLFRALPFESPQHLMWITSVRSDNRSAPFSLPEYVDYRRQVRSLSGLAAYATWSASLSGEEAAERLTGARMSGNAFEVLGVSASAGRLLTASDDRAEAPQVVVLSYRLWQRRYGGRTEVIGTSARINGDSFAIVGVLPVHLPLPLGDIDLVTALSPDRDPLRDQRNSVNFLRFLGRLQTGVSPSQAQADLTTICQALRQQFPVEYARKVSVRVVPIHETVVGNSREALLLLFAAVFVVLATALANLVSVALVKANNRRAQVTIQIVLGASRGALVRQLAADSLVLAVSGSIAGWLLALQIERLAKRWAPQSMPRLAELTIDGTVLFFAAAMTVAVAALLTAAPFAALARAKPGDTLKSGGRSAISDRQNRRAQNVLVTGEIAAALVLVFVALVLVDNVIRLSTLHPGFTPEAVFQARVSLPSRYNAPDEVTRFYERLSDRLAAAPGVQAVGVVSIAPLSGLLATVPFSEAGQAASARDRAMANLRVVTPGYMPAVGIRLRSGRFMSDADRAETPAVAVVSAALADRFLGGRGLGQQLLIDDNNQGPRPVEVVGVVENVHQTALDAGPELDIYLALPQMHPDGVALVRNNQFWMIRTAADPARFAATFLAHLRAVDPDAAVSEPGNMRRVVDDWLRPRRINLGLLGSFALSAVLLAVLGLYGLVSYTVSQRTRELGMRMALGATEAAIQRMVLLQASRLGLAGAGISLLAAAAIRPLIERALQPVAVNPLLMSIAVSVLGSLVLFAAWLPARRAARVDPMVALRCE